jgi:hypothetical protein
MKGLKGAVRLDQPQVTKAPQQVERSIAISVIAYLMIVKFPAQDIPQRSAWSRCTLKRHFTWQLSQAQLEHSVEQPLRNGLQECKAA